jgi:hypothetical protein
MMEKEFKAADLFVPYETAKLFNEKGFNLHCIWSYKTKTRSVFKEGDMFGNPPMDENSIGAPTYLQAMDWLHETHKLFIDCFPVEVSAGETSGHRYSWTTFNLNDNDKSICDETPLGYLTVQKAREQALIETLKLI